MMDDVVALVPAEDASDGAAFVPPETTTQAQASTAEQQQDKVAPESSPQLTPSLPGSANTSPAATAASRVRPRVPVRRDGQPARICEYGTTIEETLRMVFRHG